MVVNLKSLPTWHIDVAAGFNAVGVSATTFLVQPQTLAERMEKTMIGTRWSASPRVLARLASDARRTRPEMILFLGLLALPQTVVDALVAGLDYRPLFASWVCDCFTEPQFEHWVAADHVFYFDSFLASVLPRFYPDASRCTFLPLAADPARYRPLGLAARKPALAFVGNVSPNRAQLLASIGARIPLAVHGPNADGRRFRRRRKLTSARINQLYNEHELVLNINQAPNTVNGANLRTFEVTAAGACLLTQDSDDLAQHFEPGREVLAYRDENMLIDHYERGRREPAWLAQIAEAGLARVRHEHTFQHRARRLLAALA